jgi:hypothetical protein
MRATIRATGEIEAPGARECVVSDTRATQDRCEFTPRDHPGKDSDLGRNNGPRRHETKRHVEEPRAVNV